MIIQALKRHILLLLVTLCIANSLQGKATIETPNEKHQNPVSRIKRGRTTPKPGFFKTLWAVTWEQIAETKDTYNKVNEMINNNFLPDNAPVTVPTTPSSDPNISTTTEPYKISRKEFNRIIQRNLRGIQKLFNIELAQALKNKRNSSESEWQEVKLQTEPGTTEELFCARTIEHILRCYIFDAGTDFL